MAITITELTAISDRVATDLTTYTTNSLTASANKLYVLLIQGAYSAATPRTLSSVSGGGLGSWTIVAGCSQENAGTNRRSEVAYAWSASPGAAAAISITWSGSAIGCGWSLYEISGFDTSSPIGQTGKSTGTDTSAAPALSSAQTGSVLLASLQHASNEATTVESGWIAGVNMTGSGPTTSIASAYRLLVDDLSCGFGWTTSGTYVASILEIRAAAESAPGALMTTVEYYDGSAWQNISADVLSGTLRWNGGLRGSSPVDRVAAPGVCEFELNNSTSNSGGKLGYYSPDHINKRAGWKIKAKVRITATDGTSTRYWQYRVNSITPVPGQYGPRRVEVSCRDYMEEFSTRKVSGLTIQTGQTGDVLLGLLVDSMPFPPDVESYGGGVFAFPYAFHSERDEEMACMTVLQKIAQSDLSYIYQDGSATQANAETLVYEPHTSRYEITAPAASLSDAMTGLEINHSTDGIYNKVRVTTYPVERDTTLSVLGSIPAEFSLEPGETRTIFIPYRDTSSERRISGTLYKDESGNIIVQADTDYRMSSVPGDGGNDLNANLTISPVAGANSIMITMTNSASVKGYVNKLQIRGYAIKQFDRVESVQSDSTSINTYGERTITFNMPYQDSLEFGQAVADEIVRRYKNPSTQVDSIEFIANRSSALMTYALTVGIGSRISLAETATGISNSFYVNGFEYELEAKNFLRVKWIVERAFNDTPYLTLDHQTYGLIDGSYVLAPF